MTVKIEVHLGSLIDGNESVLVNGSNTNVVLGSGVSGAIRKACGAKFQAHVSEELKKHRGGSVAPGEVFVTDAGTHPRAKWVAHVAVMDYREGIGVKSMPTLETIRRCAENLWAEIEALPDGTRKHSIAMVALGGGTGDLGVVEPTRIEAETLKAHLGMHPQSRIEKVVFYGYLDHEYEAIAGELSKHWPEIVPTLPPSVRQRLKL